MPPEPEITAELDAGALGQPDSQPRERPDTNLQLWFAAKTDLGRVRENNEDKFDWWEPTSPALLANRGRVFAVADGMGGHAAGQIASEMALKAFASAYFSGTNGRVEDALVRAVTQANAMVFDTARAIPSRGGMGCTIVLAAIVDSEASVAWAGDSRVYLVRKGIATQLTCDHSLVEEQVQLGLLTREEAAHHPRRNVITRSLGPEASVLPDIVRQPLQEGDTLVLCSDGLTGVVTDEEIAKGAPAGPPSFACGDLINLANSRGGPDNVTVAIIRVAGEAPVEAESAPAGPPEPPKRKGFFRR
jgi:protein phosphatase